MTETFRFEVASTEAAHAEIAAAMVTRGISRGLMVYAHARSLLASLAAGALGLVAGNILCWLLIGRTLPYLAGLVAIFAGLMIWRFWAIKAIRKQASLAAQASPLFSGPQTWVFDDSEVVITSEVSESRLKWAAFDRVVTGPGSIGLVSGAVFFALPIADASERSALVERVEGWMQA